MHRCCDSAAFVLITHNCYTLVWVIKSPWLQVKCLYFLFLNIFLLVLNRNYDFWHRINTKGTKTSNIMLKTVKSLPFSSFQIEKSPNWPLAWCVSLHNHTKPLKPAYRVNYFYFSLVKLLSSWLNKHMMWKSGELSGVFCWLWTFKHEYFMFCWCKREQKSDGPSLCVAL